MNFRAREKFSRFAIMKIVRKPSSTGRRLTRTRLFEEDSHVRYNNHAVGRQCNSIVEIFAVSLSSRRAKDLERRWIVRRRTVALVGRHTR
jgi:hypothetical protein